MASLTSPTILLVPGALTTPACYDLLLPYLQDQGFPVVVAALASSYPAEPDQCTAATDGQHLLDSYLLPLINDRKDVVVFAHSFGATSLSGAGQKLSKTQRLEAGLRGGVVGLVYISFATVPDGKSQLELMGGWAPFCRLDHVSIVDGGFDSTCL